MSTTSTERRLAENEMVFRRLNEQMQHGIEVTERLAREDNQPEYSITKGIAGMPLHFFCECSDEKCTKRVALPHDAYIRVRKHHSHFVIFPGHEVLAIERIIVRNKGYFIVKKFVDPPDKSPTLHPTTLNNT